MKDMDISEYAYKNGYEAGKRDTAIYLIKRFQEKMKVYQRLYYDRDSLKGYIDCLSDVRDVLLDISGELDIRSECIGIFESN